MECQVCKIRSSIGYCEETRALVCEVCSVTCHHCGKLIQREIAHVSPNSGHSYCTKCWEERQARRGARKKHESTPRPEKGGDTSFEALEAGTAAPVDADVPDVVPEEDDERILMASAWKPPPPWKLSFQAAITGLIAIVVLLLFPSFHRVVLPGGIVILTPLVLLVIPIVAILWGVVGLTSMDYMSDRTRCILGIGIGVLTIVMCVYALSKNPPEKQMQKIEYTRDTMTPVELQTWREGVLEKHRQ